MGWHFRLIVAFLGWFAHIVLIVPPTAFEKKKKKENMDCT